MLLHEDKKALEEAIRATAKHLSLPIEYVEKDYWVTYALKELASSDICDEIVFKGGTSLSKAYSMISRFSEDVDIAVLTDNLSKAQAGRKVKKASKIISDISDIFNEIDSPDTSKNSHFRKIRFQYPRIDESAPVEGQIEDSLLLEINAFADPEPYSKMPLSCYIADFFINSGQESAVSEFGLETFEMNVLCTSRTVCEKVMGLVKASYGENHINQINSKIRHLYDVHFLIADKFTCEFVESASFGEMTAKVIACDQETFKSTPWFDVPLASACVFSSLAEIWPSLESTYNGDFKAMVVGEDIPSKESLIESMGIIHRQLVKFDS
ncbi:nucleotidyl transferase AbiEii/AbiGii toxin family protein [Colwellia sp. M166]|uniref:nucleotidyl transferase AbiEii/AbiGii toxin family protein n=1 Tax=Colwellia sp. M166 TaxID=2583805 RepID=UPI00211EC58D|nr:nucleotidyl transferase AbiEii/AbiGii toxin family protein [Colwellia sp. M166]